MSGVSQKFSQAGLNLLLLTGPVLGLATKGFAPLLALSGMLAVVAMLMQPQNLKKINWKSAAPGMPFLVFMGLSLFWTRADNGAESFLVVASVVVFTFSLSSAFFKTPEQWQKKYRNRLSMSLLVGVLASLAVGTYPVTWPELANIVRSISNQTELGNIELLRQSNRSLSIVPAILFLLAGVYWQKARWPVIVLIAAAFFITANSESQTAFLAMIGGSATFLIVYLYKHAGRKLIFAATAIGLLASPLFFLKSFEGKWVANYSPQLIQQKASGEYREWIYFVYAKEALTRPLFGHGFESTHSFAPERLDDYVKLANERGIPSAVSNARRNRTVAAHAHNLPLQIIFEFGYVGAFLLLAALWVLLNIEFVRNGKAVRAAAFAAAIGLLLFAHSVWQSWLLAGLGFILFYIIVLYGHNPETRRA